MSYCPPGSAIDRWDTTNKLLEGLSSDLSNIAAIATQSVWGNVSWDRVKSWVRAGTASKYLQVGDQISVPYTYNGTDYTYVLDVWHHLDGSDDDHPKATYLNSAGKSTTGYGMVLGSHYATPFEVPMNSKEAFFIPTVTMAAGTYNFVVDVNYAWGSGICASTGETTYQFMLANAITTNVSNYHFVWNANYTTALSSISVYSSWNSTTPIETCTVTKGSSGTALGTISEIPATSSGHGYFNNIQRACYGSNNWEDSSGRSFLNSADSTWYDSSQSRFHRISSLDGKPGFLSGFNDSFLNSIVQKTNVTIPHPIDTNNTYGTSTTNDRAWSISVREHNFNNYLSNTSDGYSAEGVIFDYWKNLATYNDHTQWSGWQTYSELRTFDLGTHTSSRTVWLRSANRNANNANNFGKVNADGNVNNDNASNGNRAQPDCFANSYMGFL